MDYNDASIPNDGLFKIMKNDYTNEQSKDTHELVEVLEKLKQEREDILSKGLETQYNKLLSSIEKSINGIEGIIFATQKNAIKKNEYTRRFKASQVDENSNGEDSNNDEKLNNEYISSDDKISNKIDPLDDTLTGESENAPTNDTPLPTKPERAQKQNRGRPFWQNPLAQIFSNISLNLGRKSGHSTKKDVLTTSQQSYPHINQKCEYTGTLRSENLNPNTSLNKGTDELAYENNILSTGNKPPHNKPYAKNFLLRNNSSTKCGQTHQTLSSNYNEKTSSDQSPKQYSQNCNRPMPPYVDYGKPPITPDCHPPFPPIPPKPFPTPCDPHKKLITNELDIIRLLLLYMALKPHCPYTHRICTLAQEHLEVLGELVE